MKILCVVDGWFPSTGGSEKQAILIAENMVARGHEVEYLCPWLDANASLKDEVNGIACRRIDFLRVPGVASLTYGLHVFWFLVTRGNRYDVIHIHMVEKFALALALAKPFVRAKVLAKVAGATEFEGGVFDPRKTGLLARIARRLTLRIGVFQAISSETFERLRALGLDTQRILRLPNAIDLNRFTLSSALHDQPFEGFTVLAFCGRLVPEKSLPTLIKALAVLRERGVSGFELRLAGDGPLRAELEGSVDALGLRDCVHFAGDIDKVDAFLSEAHVYCQVSSVEGLSNSILEAMASGLPCVLSCIKANDELLREGVNGYGVQVGDSEGLADVLQRLIADNALCRELGISARHLVEKRYGVDGVIDSIEKCYRGELPAATESGVKHA